MASLFLFASRALSKIHPPNCSLAWRVVGTSSQDRSPRLGRPFRAADPIRYPGTPNDNTGRRPTAHNLQRLAPLAPPRSLRPHSDRAGPARGHAILTQNRKIAQYTVPTLP